MMINHSSSSVLPKDFSFIKNLSQRNFVGKGTYCNKFREKLSHTTGRCECILTNNGSEALQISLYVLRTMNPKCKNVAVSGYVCPTVVSAIYREGLKPLFLDVLPDSMGISMESAHDRIDESTLALICTNTGGFPDEYSKTQKLPCPVISDCAQAIGSKFNGRSITEYGLVTILSFGPTKMLTAGTGGALLIDDRNMYELAMKYSAGEMDVEYYMRNGFLTTFGQHFSDLNAGLGLSQLKRFESFLLKRRSIAQKYTDVLRSNGEVNLPSHSLDATPNFYRYYFFSDQANQWLDFLRYGGVDARSSISHNMSEYFPHSDQMPNLIKNSNRIISLPIYPSFSRGEINKVVKMLQKGLDSGLR